MGLENLLDIYCTICILYNRSAKVTLRKLKEKTMFRQGDVLLIPVENVELTGAKKIEDEGGRLILAHGEATGHHHSVSAEHAQMYTAAVGTVLVLAEATRLMHQEHAETTLPAAMYLVVRQREYSPQEIRNVQD